MASLTIPSATPILKVSITVFMRYFASSGFEEDSKLDIKPIFFSWEPFPTKSDSFSTLVTTSSTVRFLVNKDACLLASMHFSATIPKSPRFFSLLTTSFSDSPVVLDIILIIIWVATPVFLSEYAGKTLPIDRVTTFSRTSSGVLENSSDKISTFFSFPGSFSSCV